MKGFSIDLAGRARNFNLPKNQPLIPVLEAIVNSIHAIDDRIKTEPTIKGKVCITIIREPQIVMDGVDELPQIDSFEIVDNGIGFNEPNFESFLKSDSTYKASIGGKGVGRLSWLVAFTDATIDSIYKETNQFVERKFVFSPSNPEVDDRLYDCKEAKDNRTSVKLNCCKCPYRENLPKRSSTIAMHIIEHCLIYFMSPSCPEIVLNDVDGATYQLNQIFKEKIQAEENKQSFCISDQAFELLHVKVTESKIDGNKLYLCAHNRLVETKDLEKYIVDLDKTIITRDGFCYIGVLRGQYLDDSVDMNRLSFTIPESGTIENTITMEQIITTSIQWVKEFLSEYLNPVAADKMEKIRNYVTETAPQFRHLLRFMPEQIEAIKPNIPDEKLDDELYRIKREFDRSVKKENDRIISQLKDGVISTDEYIRRFEQQIGKINSANSAALADYIAHRRVILDLFEFAIRQTDTDSYQKESFIHNLIYPMRKTSDDATYEEHNLWLIDEKLSYFSYISSDVPFNNSPKEQRTDIMLLDGAEKLPLDYPVAVSDEVNTGIEYNTVVIFELKKPMRNDYNPSSNPIQQLTDYVWKLKSNKSTDKNGRYIKVGDNTKFYLYAVCDITPTLERILSDRNYTPTTDRLGYFYYNDKLNAYFEVLSFDKIVNDAKKRNKILFDKLGLLC